ncbi:MAG: hypothetical protein IT562_00600 [Alphaproteobacteria bacterium]|nr:hypothetical protein [Alphaproteobacteria bacterium]
MAPPPPRTAMEAFIAESQRVFRRELPLAKYHFVAVLGKMLRLLPRAAQLFPCIKPVWDAAIHIQAEGKDLRDMIEHDEEYLAGSGWKQGKFLRSMEVPGIPRTEPGIADATAMIVTKDGHFLGARFHVEAALVELEKIAQAADNLPMPRRQ